MKAGQSSQPDYGSSKMQGQQGQQGQQDLKQGLGVNQQNMQGQQGPTIQGQGQSKMEVQQQPGQSNVTQSSK